MYMKIYIRGPWQLRLSKYVIKVQGLNQIFAN